MDFFIQKESKLDIPSVNNMYFVGSDKKFHLSSLAHGYKEYLRHKIDEYLTSHTIKKTSNDVVATISFFIPKTSKNRDLDNMLKATIDSLQ
jgi:Holliday junction resolvase RusA-like endonuclease